MLKLESIFRVNLFDLTYKGNIYFTNSIVYSPKKNCGLASPIKYSTHEYFILGRKFRGQRYRSKNFLFLLSFFLSFFFSGKIKKEKKKEKEKKKIIVAQDKSFEDLQTATAPEGGADATGSCVSGKLNENKRESLDVG